MRLYMYEAAYTSDSLGDQIKESKDRLLRRQACA